MMFSSNSQTMFGYVPQNKKHFFQKLRLIDSIYCWIFSSTLNVNSSLTTEDEKYIERIKNVNLTLYYLTRAFVYECLGTKWSEYAIEAYALAISTYLDNKQQFDDLQKNYQTHLANVLKSSKNKPVKPSLTEMDVDDGDEDKEEEELLKKFSGLNVDEQSQIQSEKKMDVDCKDSNKRCHSLVHSILMTSNVVTLIKQLSDNLKTDKHNRKRCRSHNTTDGEPSEAKVPRVEFLERKVSSSAMSINIDTPAISTNVPNKETKHSRRNSI